MLAVSHLFLWLTWSLLPEILASSRLHFLLTMLTPASARDRLTSTTIAISPRTTGNQTKGQILDKRFIPVSRKVKEMSPMIATAYCLERVFRPLPRVGNQIRVCWSHRVEEAQIKVWEEPGG